MDDFNNFVVSDRKDNMERIHSVIYHDDNCETYSHKKVCKLKEEFIHHVSTIRPIVDTKKDIFGVSISCNFFEQEKLTTRIHP